MHDFLELADLVKFARYLPSDEENKIMYEWAFTFVEETKIILETVETEPETPVREVQT